MKLHITVAISMFLLFDLCTKQVSSRPNPTYIVSREDDINRIEISGNVHNESINQESVTDDESGTILEIIRRWKRSPQHYAGGKHYGYGSGMKTHSNGGGFGRPGHAYPQKSATASSRRNRRAHQHDERRNNGQSRDVQYTHQTRALRQYG